MVLATNVPVTYVVAGSQRNGVMIGDLLDTANSLLEQEEPPLVLTTSYVFDEPAADGGDLQQMAQYVFSLSSTTGRTLRGPQSDMPRVRSVRCAGNVSHLRSGRRRRHWRYRSSEREVRSDDVLALFPVYLSLVSAGDIPGLESADLM